jgi:hypothetical protein
MSCCMVYNWKEMFVVIGHVISRRDCIYPLVSAIDFTEAPQGRTSGDLETLECLFQVMNRVRRWEMGY